MRIDNDLRRRRFEKDFVTLAAVFATLMVLTNIIGTKLFLFFPDWLTSGFGPITDGQLVVLTTGLVTYPLTFLVTDVVSEVWGRRRANHIVFLGFLCSLIMLLVIQVAVWVPRADRYWGDAANQPVDGTQVLADAGADAQQLFLDDGSRLRLDADDAEAVALVVTDDGPLPIRYTGLTVQPHRVDGRGDLSLSAPLGADVDHGDWVLPAVVIRSVDNGRVSVDRPSRLTNGGTLLLQNGQGLSYGPPAADGSIGIDGAGPELVGMVAGIDHRRDSASMQQSYLTVFAAPGILLFASMAAYLIAQFLDVFMFHFWKNLTGGKHLWLRNNGSTAVSQLVDTITVNGTFLPIAFGMGFWPTAKVIIAVYIVKLILAWLDTPLIYLGVWLAKKRLGYGWKDEVDLAER
jgi:uncharacterized PurR-regulated membrane protein YhhQ (DUF165 family)